MADDMRERVAEALNTTPHFWGVTVGVDVERVPAFWQSVADAILPLIAEAEQKAHAAGWDEGYQQGRNDHCVYSPNSELCEIESHNPHRAALGGAE